MSTFDTIKTALTERTSKHSRLILKASSLGAGIFLIIAGILGCSSIVLGGGFVYFIGSLYAIIFGCIVMVVEVKDKSEKISAFYHLVDVYLKFLTLQRGKGLFYLGVGMLVVFMRPRGADQSSWGVNNVAALVLAIVGGLHTFKIIKEEAPPPSATAPGLTATMPPAGDGLDFSRPLETAGVGSSGPEWKEMGPMTQQSS